MAVLLDLDFGAMLCLNAILCSVLKKISARPIGIASEFDSCFIFFVFVFLQILH